MLKVLILKKRKDFVRVAQGLKVAAPGLILQAAQSLSSPHREIPEDGCFLGYTVTKKVGKAHIRNRIKQQLIFAFVLFAYIFHLQHVLTPIPSGLLQSVPWYNQLLDSVRPLGRSLVLPSVLLSKSVHGLRHAVQHQSHG